MAARILVVDDDADFREGLVELLRVKGFEVADADDVVSALDLLQTSSFDLILTDTLSPTADVSLDHVHRFRGIAEHTPVVLLTAHHQAAELDPAAVGVVDIITKPFAVDALLAQLQRIVASSPATQILVVDDELSIRVAVSEFLTLEGYPVSTATNGSEALAILEQGGPWLVILDLQMPVLDGPGLAHALADRGVPARFIIMTASPDGRRTATELGADGYLPKPFAIPDLLALVQRIQASS